MALTNNISTSHCKILHLHRVYYASPHVVSHSQPLNPQQLRSWTRQGSEPQSPDLRFPRVSRRVGLALYLRLRAVSIRASQSPVRPMSPPFNQPPTPTPLFSLPPFPAPCVPLAQWWAICSLKCNLAAERRKTHCHFLQLGKGLMRWSGPMGGRKLKMILKPLKVIGSEKEKKKILVLFVLK